MKRKPWPIILLALLHVLAPFGNIIFNSFRSGRELLQTWNFWYYALPKPLFITYVILPPLAGLFIYICRRWSYWCYVICLVFIFFSNVYGFWTNINLFNFLTLTTVMVVDILAVAYFVAPSVRKVYFDPRMRWWETAPRYNFDVHGHVGAQQVLVKNISEGGALVEASENYQEGQSVDLGWEYHGEGYKMPGKVVYRKPMGGKFGYGIRYDHTPQSKKTMSVFIKRLHKEGKMIRDRLPGPEDGFFAWLKKLVTNREGLFPKTRG
ncbi:PilZ domain-containing protein [Bdellovibrio sp. HCB337]|uniref:PilZ domain-containing protein n=1 Tax=Bdellovibrio sp. HCB337 TaxID=3394358 RepID=UPI0039A4B978